MKKNIVLTVRIDEKTYSIITKLAKKDDRTIAWISRKLIEEALQKRQTLKSRKK